MHTDPGIPLSLLISTGTKEISSAHACVQAKILRHKMNKSPKYLSGAEEKMAQQLGILAALIQDPGLVLSTATPRDSHLLDSTGTVGMRCPERQQAACMHKHTDTDICT